MRPMVSSLEFHKDFAEFRIFTTEVGIAGLDISRAISPAAMTALLYEPNNEVFSWRTPMPTVVQFFLQRENDYSFMVHIKAALSLRCTCVRCLDPVVYEENMDFSIRMLLAEHLISRKETDWQWDSTEVDMQENDEPLVGYFTDKCIDLGIILRDQIFLTLPDYPQCGARNKDYFATCNKVLPLANDQIRDNPFVKLLTKKK